MDWGSSGVRDQPAKEQPRLHSTSGFDDATAESTLDLWQRYCEQRWDADSLGLSLDVSRIRFGKNFLSEMAPQMNAALDAMHALEAGAIANPDENRMVGHYWLRMPDLAPSPQDGAGIRASIAAVEAFAQSVRSGERQGSGGLFRHVLHIGIGGSVLGPQFASQALRIAGDAISVHFLDNADPDGVESVLNQLDGQLGQTLISVVSKCGWTPTPRRVQQEVQAAYGRMGLNFGRHAVATTVTGSALDKQSIDENWLARFPLWDWVGGRTSVTAAVGLLPLALQGIDVRQLLAGAAEMDCHTRERDLRANPAALIALAWYWEGNGRGDKTMVMLPYKDRLSLMERYVRQLVMESIGKRLDRSGRLVRQGLVVYGHKGTADQHSYVQQLRDGMDNCFLTFVLVLQDSLYGGMMPLNGNTLGDHLFGGFEGTRNALFDRGRDSLTITLPDLSPQSLGALIALFERAVGLYAELVNVNAYNQPGVEKNMAGRLIDLQAQVLQQLEGGSAQTADEIAAVIGRPEQCESVFLLLEHLSRNPERCVTLVSPVSEPPQRRRWRFDGVGARRAS
jgi:glucose-6-phosphate isomerase